MKFKQATKKNKKTKRTDEGPNLGSFAKCQASIDEARQTSLTLTREKFAGSELARPLTASKCQLRCWNSRNPCRATGTSKGVRKYSALPRTVHTFEHSAAEETDSALLRSTPIRGVLLPILLCVNAPVVPRCICQVDIHRSAPKTC